MSYEQAQDKYIELMRYLMDNYEGYEPVYESYNEYRQKMKKSDEQNLNSLDRALTYFEDNNANIGRGTKPDINTYIRKSNKNTNISEEDDDDETDELNEDEVNEVKNLLNYNSKNDFLNTKMAMNYDDIKTKFKIGEKKQSTKNTFSNDKYAVRYNDAMGAFKDNFTGKDMTVGYNSKYIKPDYVKSVFLPKHEKWTATYDDVDNDGYDDVSIFDDKNRLRVFNGYYFNDDTEKDKLRHYLIHNPNNSYKDYLDVKFAQKNELRKAKGLPPLVRGGNKPYKTHVKNFVKSLHNFLKDVLNSNMNQHQRMLFNSSGFESKISSDVDRFLVLPFILLKLGYDKTRVHNIVYAEKGTKEEPNVEYNIRMGILRSKEIKDLYKNNVEYIEKALTAMTNDYAKNFVVIQNGQRVPIVDNCVKFVNDYLTDTKRMFIKNTLYEQAIKTASSS